MGVQHSTLGVYQWGNASSFLNRFYWFGVVGLCRLGLHQEGRASSWSQLFILVQCTLGLCTCVVDQHWVGASSFLNRLYWFAVVGIPVHFSLISWGGPPHFSIGSTGLVQQDSVHLGSLGRGGPPHFLIGYAGLVQQGSTLGVNLGGRASPFLNRLYWFGVVGHCTSALDQQWRDSVMQQGYVPLGSIGWFHFHWVCEYFSIGSTGLVQQGSVHLKFNSRGEPPHFSIGYTALIQYCFVHLPSISKAAFSFLNRFYWFAVVGHCTLGCNQQGRSSSFFNRLFQFGLVGLCTLGVDQQGRASSFLNRLYWLGVVRLCTLWVDQLGRAF